MNKGRRLAERLQIEQGPGVLLVHRPEIVQMLGEWLMQLRMAL